jgi:hypothetical protein
MIARGVKRAYVFTKADRRGSWVTEGETVQGWTVEAIDSSGARLKQDSRSLELSLYGER